MAVWFISRYDDSLADVTIRRGEDADFGSAWFMYHRGCDEMFILYMDMRC